MANIPCMKTVACIIARTASTRLPKKVLKKIKSRMLIEYIIEKVRHVRNLDETYLCTSIDHDDRILLEVAERNSIKSYAGSRESPVDRMLDVAQLENADNVVRITGDNVFTDEFFLERMISEHKSDSSIDYTRTEYLALGVTAEVIRVSALMKCYKMMDPQISEYLTLFIFNPGEFNCQVLIPEEFLKAESFSLTVDTPQDFQRTEFLIEHLYRNGRIYYDDIIRLNKRSKIPHFRINENANIKLPRGESIAYGDFRRKFIDERIEGSKKVFLEKGFYENQRSDQ